MTAAKARVRASNVDEADRLSGTFSYGRIELRYLSPRLLLVNVPAQLFSAERYRSTTRPDARQVSRSKSIGNLLSAYPDSSFPATGHRLPNIFEYSAILFVKAKVNTVVFTSLMNLDFAKSLACCGFW